MTEDDKYDERIEHLIKKYIKDKLSIKIEHKDSYYCNSEVIIVSLYLDGDFFSEDSFYVDK